MSESAWRCREDRSLCEAVQASIEEGRLVPGAEALCLLMLHRARCGGTSDLLAALCDLSLALTRLQLALHDGDTMQAAKSDLAAALRAWLLATPISSGACEALKDLSRAA